MASSVILPPTLRRLRHVEQFLARNIPKSNGAPSSPTATVDPNIVQHNASAVSCVTSYVVLRDIESRQIFHIGTPEQDTQHPVWEPLPSDIRQMPTTRFVCSIYVQKPDCEVCPATDELLFESIVDLSRLQFLVKSIATLSDLHRLPSMFGEQSDGNHFVLMIKCSDGVFFPSVVAPAMDEVIELQRQSRQASPSGSGGADGKKAGTTALEKMDDWDLVDVDAVREEERRMQKTESVTVGDAKSFATAATTLVFAKKILKQRHNALREKVSDTMQKNLIDAQLAAEQNEAQLRINNLRAAIEAKQMRIAATQSNQKAKREELTSRSIAVASDARAIEERRSKACRCQEKAERLSTVQSELNARRNRLLSGMVEAFPMTPDTICGHKVPEGDAGPDTEQHAIALGHVAHMLSVFCSINNCPLPHPMYIASSRSYICERPGLPDEKRLPLFPAKGTDKYQLRKAVDLLKGNIVSAALTVHKQQQAEGLPLLLALQKLIANR